MGALPGPCISGHNRSFDSFRSGAAGESFSARVGTRIPQEVGRGLCGAAIGADARPGGEKVILSTFVDITERKRAEEALRESQRLLQDVIDGSPSPIFLKDRDWKFITINTPLEKMLGMTREELKGKTDYDIATKEMADYWRSHDEQVMKTGKPLQIEEVADLKDGHHVFLANKFPLVDASGQIYGVGAISHDITAQRRVEDALHESEQQLRMFYESGLVGMFSWHIDGRLTEVNDQFLRMVGYSREDLKRDG